jgi:hypothetical protein
MLNGPETGTIAQKSGFSGWISTLPDIPFFG